MSFIYHKDIVEILTNRPEGLRVSAIAVHIYNRQRGLFDDGCKYDKIYAAVKQYLWTQSQKPHSIIKAVKDKRGYYTISNSYFLQHSFDFDKSEYLVSEPMDNDMKKDKTNQLNLFD